MERAATVTSVRPVRADEQSALESLVQLYCYDWSEMRPLDVGVDGRFAALSDLARYWVDEWRHPLFITVGETLAGFALVVEQSRLTGAHGVFDMAEFFVMRRYRRKGVGRAAALRVLGMFRGPWEVRQREENPAATSFWRKVIADYLKEAGEDFEEIHWAGPEWTGIVQRFKCS
jgi:predicted acetyltransferase